jgi:pilus assembly protein CpaC
MGEMKMKSQLMLMGMLLAATTSLHASIPSSLEMMIGEPAVLAAGKVKRLVISNPALLSAKTLSDGSYVLVGRQAGDTTALAWSTEGKTQVIQVKVRSPEIQNLRDEVSRVLGGTSSIRFESVGDKLIVAGTLNDPVQVEQLKLMVEKNPRVISLVDASGQEKMIAMEVRFLEVKKNALENIGVNWQKNMVGPMVGVVGDFSTNQHFRSTSDGTISNGSPNISPNFPGLASVATGSKVSPFAVYFGLQTTLGSVINLMEQSGDAVVLAEPILTCKSGGSARFLAGGEIPLPVVNGVGSSSVQFKPYGIRFEVKPRVHEGGSISATISTELSTVDPSIKVGDLPAFLSRMTETQVNLREGQTLVMSGLISEEGSKSLDKLSGLADIPLLGALFRSKDFREKRSEMVVLLTPRFIDASSELNQRLIRNSELKLKSSRDALNPPRTNSLDSDPADLKTQEYPHD